MSSTDGRRQVRFARLLACGSLGLLLAAALVLLPDGAAAESGVVGAATAPPVLAQAGAPTDPAALPAPPARPTSLKPPSNLMALLALQQTKLTASDGASDDEFGWSVAISGDTALVGTNGFGVPEGAAYVFVRSGTTWTQQAEFTTPDGSGLWPDFGYSVALDGDTAVVAYPGYSTLSMYGSGIAYVFVRSGTTWSEQGVLSPSDDANLVESFGSSVAISGDTVMVGADGTEVGGLTGGVPNGGGVNSQGDAYVFVRSGAIWTQQAELTASDGSAFDYFGGSAALDGDTAIIGMAYPNSGGSPPPGNAYVFVRSGTTWTQQAELTASDGVAGDLFGSTVAVSGDTALIGAPLHTLSPESDSSFTHQGAAYVFVRSGTAWKQQAELSPTEGDNGFGWSVALDGDTALVGVSDNNDIATGGIDHFGSVFVYARSGTTWSKQTALLQPDPNNYRTSYAGSVSLSGATALVGEWSAPVGSNIDQGAAYAYRLVPAPSVTLKASRLSLTLGHSVTLSGVVSNAVAGRTRVIISRKISSKLVVLKNLTIGSRGAYRWTMKPKKVGKCVLLVSYKAGGETFKSKTVTLTVRK